MRICKNIKKQTILNLQLFSLKIAYVIDFWLEREKLIFIERKLI